jgi:xanthine dehydrogenase accessory factor
LKKWLETRAVLDELASRAGATAALATVVRVIGSAYRHEGAKLLVRADGGTVGNVSGGCLEGDVREAAFGVIRTGRAELRTYCSGADEIAAWDLGLGCEGRVDVFIEPAIEPRDRERQLLDERLPFAVCTEIPGTREGGSGKRLVVTQPCVDGDLGSAELNARAAARARELLGSECSSLEEIAGHSVFFDLFVPPPDLVICGAGEDAPALAGAAAAVGFRVTVVDRRPGYLRAERFPRAIRLVNSDADTLADRAPLDASTYAVVMTHNFAADRAYLRALLATPAAYVGVLGPRERTERMLGLLRAGAPIDETRVYGPVGLDIGTDGAEQVALAVVAEILAVRSGRRPQSLRARRAPIHMRVAGIVLAAGASRRMGPGHNKLLLELDGEPLVRRAVRRALAAGLSPVVVVLGHEAERARAVLAGLDYESVVNPDFTGPTSGSLHVALRRLDADVDAAVVMLGDMVHVSERMLADLVAAARAGSAPLVVSRYGDVTAPPLLFRRPLFAELLAWTGEGCGKAVVERHRDRARVLDWPAERLADVDTPEDFAAVAGITTTP